MTIKIRTAYDESRVPVHVECKDPSLTRQEFVAECDINRIMARYAAGNPVGQVPEGAIFGDFSEVGDFQQAQELVTAALREFNALPAAVRDRFSHDPVKFLQFVNDEKNLEEGRKLGIFKPAEPAPVQPKPMEVVIVDGANFPAKEPTP